MNLFLGIIGSILLALFVGWINGRNSRKNRLANASERFRNIVIQELKEVYPNPANWPENIDGFLRARFTTLQAAVEAFCPFVPFYSRWFFRRVWVSYYNAYKSGGCECYHHYMPFSGESVVNGKRTKNDNTKTYKQTFKRNIDQLLKFANKT